METKVLSTETIGQDRVGRIAGQWSTERPDLDPSPLLVVARIAWLAERFDRALRAPFAAEGLGNGDFDVLAALRRVGPPYALRHHQLSAATLVTPGAVTKRVARMAAQGYVERQSDPDDRRSRQVSLTPAGVRLVDRLIEVHLRNEARLLAGLRDRERQQLAQLLGLLALSLDQAGGEDAAHDA